MTLQRIVVAVDESDAGRWAARAALHLATGTGAEVSVLRTVVGLPQPALADVGGLAIGAEPPTAPQLEVERLGSSRRPSPGSRSRWPSPMASPASRSAAMRRRCGPTW